MMNATLDTVITNTNTDAQGLSAMLLGLVLLAVFLFGLLLGALANRRGILVSRVELRAMKEYITHPDAQDELVQSVLKHRIRRLQDRLKIDEVED